ncbi:MAG: hypothetical protein DRJ15_03910 [Bacteroidetes bacterium]|nr:MAG: hypothetical protein DRJ15_03910 [Bacteroidota bacterium]
MLKNVLLILVAAVMVWSCGNQQAEQKEQTVEEEVVVVDEKPVALSLAEFDEKAETFVGKEIILEGTVIHVCKHGGQKMFITADDPDVRIKITTTDETAAFDPELEGSDIKVVGIVEEIEAEVVGEGKHAEGEEEGHEEDAEHENYYHKPQYSLKCIKYAVVENTPEEK